MDKSAFKPKKISLGTKIAFQTLILSLFLVLINFVVNMKFIWASPLIQSSVLLCASLMYYFTLIVYMNCYSKTVSRYIDLCPVLFFSLGFINLTMFFVSYNILNKSFFILNNTLSDNILPFVMSVFFIYIGIVSIVKLCILRSKNIKI